MYYSDAEEQLCCKEKERALKVVPWPLEINLALRIAQKAIMVKMSCYG